MFTIFTVFTKKQQVAIDRMIDLHTINHDDLGDITSKYIMDKLTDMGVFEYDKMDRFWDFSSAFHSYLLSMGVIDSFGSERISHEQTIWEIIEAKKEVQEATQEAITEVSETVKEENTPETVSSQSDDEYDDCAYCGKKFLARCSADNFYCDQCYSAGYHLPLDNDFDNSDYFIPDCEDCGGSMAYHEEGCPHNHA